MTTRPDTYRIEVKLRPEFADAAGSDALALLHEAGVNAAREVRVCQLYEVRGPLNGGHVQQLAKELLCDAVTQEFKFFGNDAVSNGMNYWRVEVWLKDSVTDPVGESVRKAAAEMGLPAPESVRAAVAYRIWGKCGRNHLERAVAKCLANPVIHRVSVTEAHD